MKTKKPSPLFRPLIKEAYTTSIRFRSFWAIAAIAGLMGTGSIVGDVIHQGTLTQHLPNINPFSAFGSLVTSKSELISTWGTQTINISPGAVIQTVLACGLFALMSLIIIATCQCILLIALPRLTAGRPVPTLASLRRLITKKHIFRTIVIDMFIKVLLVDLFLLGNAGLHTIASLPKILFFPGFFLITTLTIICAFMITITGFFALIAAVNQDLSPAGALTTAWNICRKHLVVCLETSIVQFAVSFFGSFLYILLMVVGATFLAPLFALFFINGSLIAMSIVFFLYMICMAVGTVAFGGFITSLTYSLWIGVYEVLTRHRLPYPSRIAHHLQRT